MTKKCRHPRSRRWVFSAGSRASRRGMIIDVVIGGIVGDQAVTSARRIEWCERCGAIRFDETQQFFGPLRD